MFSIRSLPLRRPMGGRPRLRLLPSAWAVAQLGIALAVQAQPASSAGAGLRAADAAEPGGTLRLRLDRDWSTLPGGEGARALPAYVRASSIRLRPSTELVAQGEVEFRRGGLVLETERLEYRYADDTLRASGGVRITSAGASFRGPQLQLQLETFSGWFESPSFEFLPLGAGGDADRVEFLDSARARAIRARYTSCPRDQPQSPAWELTGDQVDFDVEANEGRAKGAVLRFLGVPILAAPRLSFPITGERKSGWLPPNVNLDNRSGVDIAVPYYWNIAPNRDATITPRIMTRRGFGGEVEFRYLEPRYEGSVGIEGLPHDRAAGRSRYALRAAHRGTLGERVGWLGGTQLSWKADYVSDDDWWKDFPRATGSLTPRLLAQAAGAEKPLTWRGFTGAAYARLAQWQVLKSGDGMVSPYQRSPQLGLRLHGELGGGVEALLETELNRFTLPRPDATDALRPTGVRWHATGVVSRPLRGSGWWLTPTVSLNAAVYDTAGRDSASRVLPTLSMDAGAAFERRLSLFGSDLRQVLEPRAHYVRTPYRDQSRLPNYDSAGKDFNITSIFSDNAWSGIDRISDSHQLTLGATTRLLREADGAEVLRLGLVQRVLLDPERVTPDDAEPTVQAATPLTRRLSDVLLLGATQIFPRWTLEGTVRFNADTQRAIRSVLSARYAAPDDFRAFSMSYRFTRGQAEQLDIGWQWPLSPWRSASAAASPGAKRSSASCTGRLYGVGRINYSMVDSRITDSLLGLEYDAGCWIGRIVAERVSTGRTDATTRLMLQLELVGLSRLGSNPLRVLKENIPGYRLLREGRGEAPFEGMSNDD